MLTAHYCTDHTLHWPHTPVAVQAPPHAPPQARSLTRGRRAARAARQTTTSGPRCTSASARARTTSSSTSSPSRATSPTRCGARASPCAPYGRAVQTVRRTGSPTRCGGGAAPNGRRARKCTVSTNRRASGGVFDVYIVYGQLCPAERRTPRLRRTARIYIFAYQSTGTVLIVSTNRHASRCPAGPDAPPLQPVKGCSPLAYGRTGCMPRAAGRKGPVRQGLQTSAWAHGAYVGSPWW